VNIVTYGNCFGTAIGLVQMRTRIMNQLQAVAMNEGYRWKKKLFSEQGRALLEKLPLAPWASRRRKELLELLDQLDSSSRARSQATARGAAVDDPSWGGTGHRASLRSGPWDAGSVSLWQADR